MNHSIRRVPLVALVVFSGFLLGSKPALSKDQPQPTSPEPVSRCQVKNKDLGAYATALLQHVKDQGESFKGTRILQNQLSVSGDSSELNKNILFEGFVRPDSNYYRIVPGLGLGVNIDEHTFLHLCIDLRPDDRNSRITFTFLKATGLDRTGFLSRFPVRARRASSNMQLRPINEGVLLLGAIPIIGTVAPKFLQRGAEEVETNLYRIIGLVGGLGAQEIVVAPQHVTVKFGAEILTIPITPLIPHKIPLDSGWMNSNPAHKDTRPIKEDE